MAATFQLHSYFRSSAAYRVRIALNLKGIDYGQVPVHLVKNGGEQLMDTYRAVNPDGLVPALSVFASESEHVLTQSLAIIEYIDERFPDRPLLPASAEDRAFVRAVALQIACEIHPVNNLRVLKYLKAVVGISDQQKDAWYKHWIDLGLASLERRLHTDNRVGQFVFCDKPSIADICLVPQIWNARRFNISLTDYPTVVRIADQANTLSAFANAAPSQQPDAE